jgi:flagellar L-ring protein precursor FlgH
VKRFFWKVLSAGIVLTPGAVHADSIWARREPRSAFLFVDERARRIGDVLTIQVQEQTNIGNQDQRQLSKDAKASGIFTFKGSTQGGKSTRSGQVDFEPSGSSQRAFDGTSNYTVGRSFIDTLSVTVIDVLPNGNLVVEGFRRQVVTGEQRMMRVSGIVRPDDITLTNTVLSQFIANLQISYVGTGPESRFVNQGYVGKLFNWVWPW